MDLFSIFLQNIALGGTKNPCRGGPSGATKLTENLLKNREPGNMNLERGRIFGLVLFKIRVSDQGVGHAGQRQSGAGAGMRFMVLLRIIEQDKKLLKS